MSSFGSKQSYDEYYVAFNFSNAIGKDTIASATVTAVDDTGADKTTTVTTATKQNIDGPRVNVWVKGGVTGKTYTITCKIITTTNAEKYELDGDLPVAEV